MIQNKNSGPDMVPEFLLYSNSLKLILFFIK